ncbi:glycosyltransferase [Aeromonas veronii]|uniref:glycosyltransferase n=1 Tax=Aeromonas dhakensis TaxID=196024 RepID=UPI002B490D1A|nr:glycosyltransferase [Aeromonas dhakensis]
MKIIHISKYYPPYFGGIENVAYDLVEGVNKDEIQCDVICSNDTNESQIDQVGNYSVFRVARLAEIFSTPICISMISKFLNIVKTYDIIHLHHPNPFASLSLFLALPFIKNKKLIVHWHSDIVKQKKLKCIFFPLQKVMLHRADLIVATSEPYLFSSKDLQPYLLKSIVIPIGVESLVDMVNFDQVKEIKCLYKDKFIVFSLGRHVYYKGFQYLLDAAKELSESTVILIGGDGPLTNELKAFVQDNNLQHKVFFLGKIPSEKLASYFYASDLFCLPSIEKSEAFGVVQIEAMSLGKPIVSTHIEGSGVSWVNKNMESGLVVQVKDSHALSKAIQRMQHDIELYKRLSEGAVKRYESLFSKKKMIENFVKLYRGK